MIRRRSPNIDGVIMPLNFRRIVTDGKLASTNSPFVVPHHEEKFDLNAASSASVHASFVNFGHVDPKQTFFAKSASTLFALILLRLLYDQVITECKSILEIADVSSKISAFDKHLTTFITI